MAGKTVDTIQLELDELLERSHSSDPVLKLENVTLDVNLTLHLLNRYARPWRWRWVYGCMGVCMCGCVDVWMCGCVGVWLYGLV